MATRIPPGRRPAPRMASPTATASGVSLARRYLGFILGGIAGVALVLAVSALLAGRGSQPSQAAPPAPDSVAGGVCADLRAHDYPHLYTTLSPAQQGVGPADQFIASQRQIDALHGSVSACAYTLRRVSASSASVTYTLTRNGAATLGAVTLDYVNGEWRISDYDTSSI